MDNTTTHVITDSEGNRITYCTSTEEIISTIDRYGFIFNPKGERTGNVHGLEYIEGYHYD